MRGLRAWLASPALYRGLRVQCPVCGGRFRRFRAYRGRRNAYCPRCGCGERHRLFWLYLMTETDLPRERRSVLHFAPEPAIASRLAALPNLDYASGDLESVHAMERMDITAIPRPDSSVDVILCSHVLEHVPDDAAAIREMHRVLTAGGVALLQHPVDRSRATTYEEWTLTSAEERLRAFGQEDHVRVYGRDLEDRLDAAGFAVEVVPYIERLDPGLVRRHGLAVRGDPALADDVYVCRKA